jgi:hypothetical protein
VRLGNRIYYRRADLEAFIEKHVVRMRDRGLKMKM